MRIVLQQPGYEDVVFEKTDDEILDYFMQRVGAVASARSGEPFNIPAESEEATPTKRAVFAALMLQGLVQGSGPARHVFVDEAVKLADALIAKLDEKK
jgi:hypothetical protein